MGLPSRLLDKEEVTTVSSGWQQVEKVATSGGRLPGSKSWRWQQGGNKWKLLQSGCLVQLLSLAIKGDSCSLNYWRCNNNNNNNNNNDVKDNNFKNKFSAATTTV